MPNPNVVLSAFLSALALYGLRECAFEVWLCLVVLPALLYALCAERTSRTTLAGKHVLVTGASSGLGLELAKEAARRGAAAVLLVSRGREHLEAAAHACEAVATHPDFESARARADDAGRGAGSSAALLASRGARVVAPRGRGPAADVSADVWDRTDQLDGERGRGGCRTGRQAGESWRRRGCRADRPRGSRSDDARRCSRRAT